jgi:hypothetical protein
MKLSWKSIPVILFVLISLYSCVNGKGDIVTETIGISGFTKIEHGTKGDVILVKDDNQFVEIIGQQNIIDILKLEVDGGKLKIKTKGGKSIGKYDQLTFYVHAPFIEEVKVSSAGTVTGGEGITGDNFSGVVSSNGKLEINDLDAEFVEAVVSGSGRLTLRGTATNAEFGVGSSGAIAGFELAVANNKVELRGNGIIETTTNSTLEVRLLGNGAIYYKGNPTISTPVNNGQGVLIDAN